MSWKASALIRYLWTITAVSAVFLEAILRLGRRGISTLQGDLAPAHYVFLFVAVPALCYFEGYRGLQRRFVPAVLRRTRIAARRPGWAQAALGPIRALGLVGGGRREILRSWAAVAAIVAAVLIVRALPDPWRGLVDVAVAAALTWGLIALITVSSRNATRRGP